MANTDIEPTRKRQLDRGRNRINLIRDLASGKSGTDLAEKLGVTPGAIYAFQRRHADAIEAAAADFESEFAGLWIASKAKRLAEIESVAAHIDALMSDEVAEALDEWVSSKEDHEKEHALERLAESALGDPNALRIKLAALKQAAEELGQIPTKTVVEVKGSVVNYVVEGVDMEKLK